MLYFDKIRKKFKNPLTNPRFCAIITPIKDHDGEDALIRSPERWRLVRAIDTIPAFVAPESEGRNPMRLRREGLDPSRPLGRVSVKRVDRPD